MIKQLVDLQRNSKATCAVIRTAEYKKLSPAVSVRADIDNQLLFGGKKPVFADKLDEVSRKAEICYLLIAGLDTISLDAQNRYVGLVKDRIINDYTLPNNAIIVFTVKDKTSLKNISPEINHFSVVAF